MVFSVRGPCFFEELKVSFKCVDDVIIIEIVGIELLDDDQYEKFEHNE